MTHPIEGIILSMSKRDQKIANELSEQGFSDEDLYAALPNRGADKLLTPARVIPPKETP